jgi:hypothetical protein
MLAATVTCLRYNEQEHVTKYYRNGLRKPEEEIWEI